MDFQLINLLAAIFAAWRITSALNREGIGKTFRSIFAGETVDVDGLLTHQENFIAELVMCFWCLSFWVSAACFLLFIFFPALLYPFAISSMVILLDKAY